jgi:hypothetical protein
MRWAAPNSGYFLSELDEAGAAGEVGALDAAAGFTSLPDVAEASVDDLPESLFGLLSLSLEDFGFVWL